MKCKLLFIYISFANCLLHIQISYCNGADRTVADSLAEGKKYDKAITEYKRYLFEDKNEAYYPSIYWNIGSCYFNLNQSDKALEMFNKSILYTDNDSLKTKRQLCLGIYYMHHQEYIKANALLSQISAETEHILFLKGINFLFNFEAEKCKSIIDSSAPGRLGTDSRNRLMDLYNMQTNLKLVSSKKAVFLSCVIPGSGQFYCGERLNGIHSFLLNFIFAYLSINSFSKGKNLQGFAFTYIFSRFYIRNIMNAKSFVKNYNENSKTQFLSEMRSKLSFILEIKIPFYF
jgi:TM2 domain-containing membrane protein YozV